MSKAPGISVESLSLLNALGAGVTAVGERLFAGARGLRAFRAFPELTPKPHETFAGQIPDELLRAPSGPHVPRQSLLARHCLNQVETRIRAATERWGSERVGLLLGSSTGGIEASEVAYAVWRKTGKLPPEYSLEEQHAFDGIVKQLAAELDLAGPMYVVSTACSSSAKALAAGARLIRAGYADAVLVAGIDSLCLTTLLGFHALGVVDPKGCRPFAPDRRGMNIGEGAAALLLQRHPGEQSLERGGVFLLAAGESCDAHHMAHPHPDGIGAERAMREALETAGVDPGEVSYVNAHGTGTVQNDAVEATALNRMFGTRADHGPVVSSTKGATGHLLGACGATEAAFAAAAITASEVPGNGDWATDETLPISIPRRSLKKQIDFVLSNSFAFGGSNASLLFGAGHALGPDTIPTTESEPGWLEVVQLRSTVVSEAETNTTIDARQSLLSARALGRASRLTRSFADTLSALVAGGFDAKHFPVVFGSAHGEMETTLQLLEVEVSRGESSPLRFQVSVHNAAQGLLSIATGHQGFSTSIAAGKATCAMALVEATAYLGCSPVAEIAVLIADESAPAPLARKHYDGLVVGLHLKAASREAQPHKHLVSSPYVTTVVPDDALEPPQLDAALRDNPSAAALNLAWAIDHQMKGCLLLSDPSSKPGVHWAIDCRPAS